MTSCLEAAGGGDGGLRSGPSGIPVQGALGAAGTSKLASRILEACRLVRESHG